MKTNNKTTSRQTTWLRYLKGELSDSENYDVENQLILNEEDRAIVEAIAHEELSSNEIEKDLADVNKRWHNRVSAPRRVINPWIRRAVAGFFLGFAAWASIQYYEDQKGNKLYAEYFETDSYLAVRGGDMVDPSFSKAMQSFEAKNYESSFAQFQYLSEQLKNDPQTYLYAAFSAMQLDRNFEAKQLLNQVKNLDVNNGSKAEVYWYMALIYLREKDNINCKEELNWLLQNTPNTQWGSNAVNLLEELD